MFRYFWLTIALIIAMSGLTIDASIEKAILLKAHGLNDDAKRELINLIFGENFKGKDKSRAYYLLGEIAFDENRIQAATRTWGYIVEKYPDSDEALIVKERIDELSKVTLAVYTESFESTDYSVAKLYLKNAEFWSEDKDDRWMIDSSWIPKVEFALKWYNKVISEFPKSDAARIAYIGKIRTLLSWKEFDRFDRTDEVTEVAQQIIFSGKELDIDEVVEVAEQIIFFPIYVEQLVNTFRDFEKDFPNDTTLQSCRFQIGQAYFGDGVMFPSQNTFLSDKNRARNSLEQAKKWFDEVIVNSGGRNTFYLQISEERNRHINKKIK